MLTDKRIKYLNQVDLEEEIAREEIAFARHQLKWAKMRFKNSTLTDSPEIFFDGETPNYFKDRIRKNKELIQYHKKRLRAVVDMRDGINTCPACDSVIESWYSYCPCCGQRLMPLLPEDDDVDWVLEAPDDSLFTECDSLYRESLTQNKPKCP